MTVHLHVRVYVCTKRVFYAINSGQILVGTLASSEMTSLISLRIALIFDEKVVVVCKI